MRHTRADLQRVARAAMVARGLEPDFRPEALAQLQAITGPAPAAAGVVDMRDRLWCSIDNDDSRDLDQLSVGRALADDATELMVAIADVDSLVPAGSPIDRHAAINTTSVYTAARIFPMLPERLSTDLTSLNPDQDRTAFVIRYTVDADGTVRDPELFRALVRNHAKLAYNAVAAWLTGVGELPEAAARVPGMDAQLRLQDHAAEALRDARARRGALHFQSLEARVVFQDEQVVGLEPDAPNRAKGLIEELMVAANGVVARWLAAARRPSLRRVVRSPERWAKIVGVAARFGESLPNEPSSAALEAFLAKRRAADPVRFPDLSLVIVKLMGRGEYVAEAPGEAPVGHFGLAVDDYAHSTAPNRRYPDLITQRLAFAALAGNPTAYDVGALAEIAAQCTQQEAAATKVERQVRKSAAALLLEGRLGATFKGVVTGATDRGTFVRTFAPPVEGRVVEGYLGLDVGDFVTVKLLHTDFERGFLDFARV